jgi:hypothetical protein
MQALALKECRTFGVHYLKAALDAGIIAMTIVGKDWLNRE